MNKKIVFMYLKMVIVAIVFIIAVWFILCYFLLFADKTVNENLPQYLILSIEESVEMEGNEIRVQDSLLKRLDDGEVWMQILDQEGKCIYEHLVPKEIPKEYQIFELAKICVRPNQFPGYTLFFKEIDISRKYGVILGCSNHIVSKVSYVYEGNGKDEIVNMVVLFILTVAVVIVFSALLFSRKISQPVSAIIDNINEIEHGKFIKKEQKSNIFKGVFVTLEKLHDSLKENERMREEWSANISHDLKTPLATIRGYAEILQNKEYSFSEEEIRMYAEEIQKAEQNMDTLVEELKISQKLKEGKIILKKEEVNITALLGQCLQEIDGTILGDSVINFKQTKDIILACDKELMRRSLQNIIHNAFIHNHCAIKLFVELEKGENEVIIRIRDTGRGMSEEEKKHIFERYYRGTSSQKTKGTGLGLAIAKEVILAHGGTIEAKSREGEGTEFYIEI